MNVYRFSENKDSLINGLKNLTPEQKEEIRAFFAVHPNYEPEINWNDRSLSYEDFVPLLKRNGKSKAQARKKGLGGLIEGEDYRYLGNGHDDEIGDYRIYEPLSYLGSKTLASNRVPPVKKNGAKWCIAYQKTDEYWYDYTVDNNIRFLFVLTDDTKYAVVLYPETAAFRVDVYDFDDKCLDSPDWLYGEDSVLRKAAPEWTYEGILSGLIEKGLLIREDDGGYSTGPNYRKADKDLDLRGFIRDGKLICRFSHWEGDFTLCSLDLKSLEGCPHTVTGDFHCDYSSLRSLEGAPKKVSGDFTCVGCMLETLEGCPEEISGSFNCSQNMLASLKGGPKIVRRDYRCNSNRLVSLEGAPQEVGGEFICSNNQLTTLIDGPEKVGGYYSCTSNRLTSLEGAPKRINGSFSCNNNRLTDLKGGPKSVEGYLLCSGNPLKSFDGGPKETDGIYFEGRLPD